MPRYVNDDWKELKNRVTRAKEFLQTGWRGKFFKENPEYDTHSGSMKVMNVLQLKCTDEKLTKLLEQMAAEYQAENLKKEEAAA